MTLHSIDQSIAMPDGRQQIIERIQITDFAERAVLQPQPPGCPTKPFIHLHLGKRDTEIDILAGNDEIFAGH